MVPVGLWIVPAAYGRLGLILLELLLNLDFYVDAGGKIELRERIDCLCS